MSEVAPWTSKTTQWLCMPCGYIFDPSEGDPEYGVLPGTLFEDLPDNYTCPVCGVGKDEFQAI